MSRIISMVGFIGSGKDTAADFLVQNHDFVRDSFAAPLKQAVAAIFGWEPGLLEGLSPVSRAWREQPDAWWSERLGVPKLTPRWILQQWGTEVCRDNFHSDIWIASLENRIRHSCNDVVISDARFFNELNSIRRLGGTCVRIQRGDDPVWWDVAKAANLGCTESQKQLAELGIHASETSWVGFEFDHVIDNTGTLTELEEKINDLAQGLQ